MKEAMKAYLQGALGDATYSKTHKTWRISQGDRRWLLRLKRLFEELGHKSWIYKEGKTRKVFVLETSAKFLSNDFEPTKLFSLAEKIAFIRGYFDAEGGVPRDPRVRFYIQFTQKDRRELNQVREILEEIGIRCGKIHNPSAKIDPHYWRFFVRAQSYQKFTGTVGSWHPGKEVLLKRWNEDIVHALWRHRG